MRTKFLRVLNPIQPNVLFPYLFSFGLFRKKTCKLNLKQEYSIKLDVVFFIYRCFSSLRCFGCQKNLALDSKAFKYSLRSVSESKWNENTILNEFVHLIIKFESLIERVRWKEKLFFFWKVPLSLILFGSMFRVNSCSVIVFFAYFNELCCFWCVDFAPFFPIVEIKSLNFFGFCCDIKAAWYFCNSLLFFFHTGDEVFAWLAQKFCGNKKIFWIWLN